MDSKIKFKLFAFLLCLFLLSSCGNNGGTNTSGTGGIEGTGRVALKGNTVSVGAISSTGSIFVNGIKYDISDANIIINGIKGKPEDLKIGMVVQVTSNFEAGQDTTNAIDITYNSLLKGMVDSIDLTNYKLIIAGQNVSIDKRTVYEGIKSESLIVGNIVSVSGFKAVDGGINATLIKYISGVFVDDDEAISIASEIVSLNTASKTFKSGELTIDYSSTTFNGLKESDLKNGIRVKITTNEKINNSILVAKKIEYASESLAGNEGHKIEIEGIADSLTSSSYYTLNGQPIILSDNVVCKNGTLSDLSLGVKMEVSGVLDKFGNIIASEIEYIIMGDIEFDAVIQSIDSSSFQIIGLTIEVETTTLFINEQDRLSIFNFSNLHIGDRIEINARKDYAGNLIASKIILEAINDEVDPTSQEIRATISNLLFPNFTLAGVNVAFSEGVTNFIDISNELIDSAIFFETIKEGSTVEVDGTFQNGLFQATIVKIIQP